MIVERVVNAIDKVVRLVRFDGRQSTHAGEREVKMALRKTLSSPYRHHLSPIFHPTIGLRKE